MKPPKSYSESARLEALRQYNILDTPPEEDFDGLTRLAKHICETPVALISLVEESRQWFKSKIGLDVSETSLDHSFCVHAILQPGDICIVPDALLDERFKTNPLVASDPKIRFYAGVPLVTPDGYALGTLCVVDYVPRVLSHEQIEALRVLARQVVAQLELRRNLAELKDTITERERAEKELRERTEKIIKYQLALLQLAKIDNSDLNSALKRITETDSKTLGVERVSIWFFSEDHSEIICKEFYKLSKDSHEGGLRLKARDYPCYFKALEKSRTIAANDACTDARTGEFAERYLKPKGIASMMDIPIRLRGKVIGIVCHEHTGTMREWTVEEQDFAASIADMVSLALEASERRRAEEALQKAHNELEIRVQERTGELVKANEALQSEIAERKRTENELRIVNSITQAMDQSLELEQVYRIALDKIIEQEYVDLTCIYLVDKAKNEAVMQYQRNFTDDFIKRAGRIPYPKGATWKVINTGEILNVQDARQNPDVGPAGRDLGFRSMLGIPIALEGKAFGALWLLSYKQGQFTKPIEDLLVSIGRQIAIAIARANLYRELSKKNRYEAIISAVTRSVHQSINLQDVFQNAAQSISQNIDKVSHFAIYMVEGKEAVIKAHKDVPDWFIERAGRVPYPKGLTWKTITEEKPRYCADVDQDTVIGPAGKGLGIKSYLSVPLHLQRKTVGTINIASFHKNAFDEDELRLLEIVAQQIEIAINNAKQAEALRISEEKFRNIVEHTNDWVWETDRNGVFTYVNPKAREILGYEQGEIIGKTTFNFMTGDEAERFSKVVEAYVSEQKPFPYIEKTLIHKDGRPVIIETSGSPIFDSQGVFQGYHGIARNINQRKKMEEELLRIQKLESLGVLAGGIAHDFNNLLTGILGNISLVKKYSDLQDKSYRRLDEAERASLRAKDLTGQLLTFSKGGVPIKKVASIGTIITDSAGFALRGSNIRCEFNLAEDLWPAEVDEGQISQVLNNLVINAQQAMPQGGVIKVKAENVNLRAEEVLSLKDGRYVKITIEDKGIGIPKEYLSKVFDPYFTTKQKGSGLGLAIVHSIIKNHNGYIGVESEIGTGTKFHMYLPACGKSVSELTNAGEESAIEGMGRVLIMDDEEIVRGILSDTLSQVGYEVEFTDDGRRAIELYREAKESGKPFDVVIMDLTIPGGMGGKEAIGKLLEIDPNVKAIVSSGYSNDPVMSEYERYGFKGVVSKPYKIEELSKTVHEVKNGEQ